MNSSLDFKQASLNLSIISSPLVHKEPADLGLGNSLALRSLLSTLCSKPFPDDLLPLLHSDFFADGRDLFHLAFAHPSKKIRGR